MVSRSSPVPPPLADAIARAEQLQPSTRDDGELQMQGSGTRSVTGSWTVGQDSYRWYWGQNTAETCNTCFSVFGITCIGNTSCWGNLSESETVQSSGVYYNWIGYFDWP